jgi:hypothetical protein
LSAGATKSLEHSNVTSKSDLVACKFEVGGISGHYDFWLKLKGHNVLYSDPMEANFPVSVELFGQQWSGTSGYEIFGGAAPKIFKLLRDGTHDQAMDLYWHRGVRCDAHCHGRPRADLLAQRYGVEQFLADAEADASAGDALEAAAPLAPTGKAAADAPPHAPTGDLAVVAAPAFAAAGEAAEPPPALASTGNTVEPAPLIATGDVAAVAEAAEAPPPLAPTAELAAATAPAGAPAAAAAQAAPPLAAPAAATEDAPPVRAPGEAAEQHHHRSRSQPGCAQARLDGACAVRFLAEPTKNVAMNANRRL